MDCAILYKDSFTDKLEWIEESKNMKGDPLELEVFGIDGRMSMLGYYGLDQLRQGFLDDSMSDDYNRSSASRLPVLISTDCTKIFGPEIQTLGPDSFQSKEPF